MEIFLNLIFLILILGVIGTIISTYCNIYGIKEKFMATSLKMLLFVGYLIISGLALAFIIGAFILVYIPYPSSDYLVSHYRYLMASDSHKYRERHLDVNDTFPGIYCLKNKTAIIDVLKDKDLMNKMARSLETSNMPCVASYHFKKTVGDNNMMPHFIMLNKRFQTLNVLGSFASWFAKTFGYGDVGYVKLFLDAFGRTTHQGDFYFIFNANEIGGSKNKDNIVKRHTSLCKWADRETKYMGFSVEIEAQEAIFHNGGVYIDDTVSIWRKDEAYCLQGFLDDIRGVRIC